MPPKRPSRRAVAAVSNEIVRNGSDPGSFQLPPYREDRPALWFIHAEGLMDMRNITDPYFRVILVQTALSYAQQDTVAHILEKGPAQPGVYQLLKAELLRLHEKSEWDRLKELLALPALGGQRGSELLATMERLCPKDHSLWLRYQFVSRLPADMQRQLAEDKGTIKELAARVDELQRKAPKAAATIAAATPEEEVVATARAQQPRTPWKPQRNDTAKRRRSKDNQGGPGGGATKKQKREPWVDLGMCRFHWRYGNDAYRCEKPCVRSGN
jgi:hypothetical protein